MATRGIISTLTLALCVSQPSEAALYEFTLEGTVTDVFGSMPAVGEPCIIRYIADNEDLEPHPGGGFFVASPPTVTFPVSNVHFDFEPVEQVTLRVSLFGTGVDIIQYQSLSDFAYNFNVGLIFPDGTLESDVLPLTLSLEGASSSFAIFPSQIVDRVRGRITSYSSVRVPEPSVSCALAFAGAALSRSRRRKGLGSRRCVW